MRPLLLTLFLLALFRPAAAQSYTVTGLGAGAPGVQSTSVKKLCLTYCVGRMSDVASLYGADTASLYQCDFFTGYASVAPDEEHAFLVRRGKVTDLDASSRAQSEPCDVNAAGQVTGFSFPFSQTLLSPHSRKYFHAFLYSGGEMQDLGTLPGDERSEGMAINDKGVIVGWSRHNHVNPDGTMLLPHAFLFQGGRMRDLISLIPPHSGWMLESATDINDRGEIRGWGIYHGEKRAFLLTPVPQTPKP